MQDFCGMDDAKSDVVDRTSVSLVDHEERRMSDLSDIWSVVSSVDNHLNGDNQVTKNVLFRGGSIYFVFIFVYDYSVCWSYTPPCFHGICIFYANVKCALIIIL